MGVTKPKRVAVIGAGISGVVTAAHLKNAGLEVTVFERNRASGGSWSVNTQKIDRHSQAHRVSGFTTNESPLNRSIPQRRLQ